MAIINQRIIYVIRNKKTNQFVGGDGSFKKARIFNLKNHATSAIKQNYAYNHWSDRNLKNKDDFEIIECGMTFIDLAQVVPD